VAVRLPSMKVLAPAAVVVAIGVTVALWPNDEAKICAQLERLAKAVRVEEGENLLLHTASLNRALEAVLTDDVHVTIPDLPVGPGRSGVLELAGKAPLFVRTFDVRFGSYEIKIDPSATTAKVGATATIDATDTRGARRYDRRAVDFLMRKDDGTWRATSITVWARRGDE
jgi:hypothetical protein